jgi:membrane fusion protein (multidrug efflux system)
VDRLQGQYSEMKQLAARGAVSDRELSDLAFNLRNARTSLREAAATHGQTRLTAPFDGVVAARDVRVGELAGGSTAAFRVVDLHQLRVVAQVPERDLSRVALDQPAVLTSAYDDAVSSTGVVRRIAPVVDSQSGTFRVTIEVASEQTALRPGQYVGIDIEVDRKVDVTVVPASAIVYEAGAPVVYVYDVATEEDLKPATPMGGMGGWGGGDNDAGEDGDAAEGEAWWAGLFGGSGDAEDAEEKEDPADVFVARRRPVEIGLGDDDVSEILSGVEVGDRVVTVGQSHLRDGVRLRDVLDPLPEEHDEDEEEGDAEDADEKEADAGEAGSDVEDHG